MHTPAVSQYAVRSASQPATPNIMLSHKIVASGKWLAIIAQPHSLSPFAAAQPYDQRLICNFISTAAPHHQITSNSPLLLPLPHTPPQTCLSPNSPHSSPASHAPLHLPPPPPTQTKKPPYSPPTKLSKTPPVQHPSSPPTS